VRVPTAPPQLVRTESRWAPITHAVVSRVRPAFSSAARTWFLLCALFALAVTVAILIAVL
jgi:hypothetical protein